MRQHESTTRVLALPVTLFCVHLLYTSSWNSQKLAAEQSLRGCIDLSTSVQIKHSPPSPFSEAGQDASPHQHSCPQPLCRHSRLTVKKVIVFPVPTGMSQTKLSLDRNNLIIPAREIFVGDVPAGVGKIGNLCYSVSSQLIP